MTRLPRHIEAVYVTLFILAVVTVIVLVKCYGIRYMAGLPSLSLLFVPLVVRVWHAVLASPLGTEPRSRALRKATLVTLGFCAVVAYIMHVRP